MSLPINIETLVHGKTIEWERLEFKRGWNPEEAVHTICAFANDLNNWGGGYIIIGVKENNGQPVLPPEGIPQNSLDRMQGEVLSLANQVYPHYYPIMQPYELQGKHILVLWCPAGDHRPYTAPSTQGKAAQRYSYIRFGSRSIIAKDDNLRRLNELAARIPFDDRVNHQATVQDFDLGLIQAFLQEIKSDLYEESKHISLADLARSMLIAKGSEEDPCPVNVGLLFFTKQPERFFPRTQIELIVHQDDSGRSFTEHYFQGALHVQLREALAFLWGNTIREHVQKVAHQAEAIRYYNFPYEAVEEVLSNAVYHKSYELGKPIEVQVWSDKIEVLSYPGPVPPVDAQILASQRRIVARDYRNRRIGDFLKELDLTERRGTGFPTIYKAMENNGSPAPVFETDAQSTYFLAVLPAHPAIEKQSAANQAANGDKLQIFKSLEDLVAFTNQATNQAANQALELLDVYVHDRVEEMLASLGEYIRRADLFEHMGLSNQSYNWEKYLDPLIASGWVQMEYPEKKTSPNQRYKMTASGERLLQLISESGP